MARTVRIIHARDFLRARPDGELDLEQSEQLLREVAGALEGREVFDVLVDTRDAESGLSATDLWYLADKLVHYPRMSTCRVAILCPGERFDYARFYALCAERHGVNVHACLSYEDAMHWLFALH